MALHKIGWTNTEERVANHQGKHIEPDGQERNLMR